MKFVMMWILVWSVCIAWLFERRVQAASSVAPALDLNLKKLIKIIAEGPTNVNGSLRTKWLSTYKGDIGAIADCNTDQALCGVIQHWDKTGEVRCVNTYGRCNEVMTIKGLTLLENKVISTACRCPPYNVIITDTYISMVNENFMLAVTDTQRSLMTDLVQGKNKIGYWVDMANTSLNVMRRQWDMRNNCVVLRVLSHMCIFEISFRQTAFSVIGLNYNPCTGERCGSGPYIKLTKANWIIDEVGSIAVDIPLDATLAQQSDDAKEVHFRDSNQTKIGSFWMQTLHITLMTDCTISTELRETILYVRIVTNGPAVFRLQLENTASIDEEGCDWQDASFVSTAPSDGSFYRTFEISEWGSYSLYWQCNKNTGVISESRSKHELCMSKRTGWGKELKFFWCMAKWKIIMYFGIISFSILLGLISKFMRGGVVLVISIPTTLAYTVFTIITMKCKRQCKNCGTFRWFKKHECLENCDWCGADLKVKIDHVAYCPKYSKSEFVKCLVISGKKNIRSVVNAIVWLITSTASVGALICLIILAGLFTSTTATTLRSPGVDTFDFTNEWHVESGVYISPKDIETTAITAKSTFEEGDGKVSFTLRSDMKAAPGSAAHFEVQSSADPDTQYKVAVYVLNTRITYGLIFQYYTCLSEIEDHSNMECASKDCKTCYGDIDVYKKDKEGWGHICHSADDTWACNGGCWRIAEGSTCGICRHKCKQYSGTVYKLGQARHQVKLCVFFAGSSRCHWIDSIEMGKDFKAIINDKAVTSETTLFWDETSVFTGNINKRGEFSQQFGSIQFSDKESTSVGDCIPSIQADKVCHFGRDRKFTFAKCCSDTHNLIDSLKLKSWRFNKDVETVEIEGLDLGLLSMQFKTRLVTNIITNPGSISEIRLLKCVGCFECDIGGFASFQVTAKQTGLYAMNLKGLIGHETVHLNKGHNIMNLKLDRTTQHPFGIIAIGSVSANLLGCSLTKGNFTYHTIPDTFIDPTTSEDNTCEFIFCLDSDFAGGVGDVILGIVKLVAMVAVLMLTLYICYKLVQFLTAVGKASQIVAVDEEAAIEPTGHYDTLVKRNVSSRAKTGKRSNPW